MIDIKTIQVGNKVRWQNTAGRLVGMYGQVIEVNTKTRKVTVQYESAWSGETIIKAFRDTQLTLVKTQNTHKADALYTRDNLSDS